MYSNMDSVDASNDFQRQIQAKNIDGHRKNRNVRSMGQNESRNPSQYNSNIILDSKTTEGMSFHESKTYFNERAKTPKKF